MKRYTFVFAENGRGKTTLCAILRSLQSGNPAYIIGRTTLAGAGTPEIDIRTDVGNVIFNNGAWSSTLPDIAVFDSTFVSENVYAGDVVDLEHRRNLYSVIVGAEGVLLAQQIDTLDASSRAKSAEIRDKSAAVQAHIPAGSGLTVESFSALPDDAEIDTKIAAKERELDAVKQAAQIRARAPLSELLLPVFPKTDLEALLGKTV
jgi:wobble nucleotide-excising tRNase